MLQPGRWCWPRPEVCEDVAGRTMPPEMPYPGTCEVTFSSHAGFADGVEVEDIEKGR